MPDEKDEKRAEATAIAAGLHASAEIAREKRWQSDMKLATSWPLRVLPYVTVCVAFGVAQFKDWSGWFPLLAFLSATCAIATLQDQTRSLASMVAQLREELDALKK